MQNILLWNLKGDTFYKPSFWVSMLNFQAVIYVYIYIYIIFIYIYRLIYSLYTVQSISFVVLIANCRSSYQPIERDCWFIFSVIIVYFLPPLTTKYKLATSFILILLVYWWYNLRNASLFQQQILFFGLMDHQKFQVPRMEVLDLIASYFRAWGNSLT